MGGPRLQTLKITAKQATMLEAPPAVDVFSWGNNSADALPAYFVDDIRLEP